MSLFSFTHLSRTGLALGAAAMLGAVSTTAAHADPIDRYGTPGDDVFRGGGQADRYFALEGADWLRGFGGRDELFGGNGEDLIAGGAHADQLHGGNGGDILIAGPGPDRVWGDRHNDDLRGGLGDDIIWPGGGVDKVTAGPGNDWIILRNDGKPDVIDCGDGTDRVRVELYNWQERETLDRYINCEAVNFVVL